MISGKGDSGEAPSRLPETDPGECVPKRVLPWSHRQYERTLARPEDTLLLSKIAVYDNINRNLKTTFL